jgi:phosphatidylglycerol:prolipoprotein diacylglycerol transferase
MYPILFELGHFELRSYGVLVALSAVAAYWLSTKEARRKGIDGRLVEDFALYALVGGLIGARLYYVGFSNPSYFLRNPLEILAFWHGGIGIIGFLLGAFLAAFWYCRRKGISVMKFGDTLAPGIALGQTLGQFACLANGDSWGKPTDLPWAITYTDPRALAPVNVPLHPIEIYEMAAYLGVFLMVWMSRKRFGANGLVFSVYLGAYGVARFSMEFFRGDPAMFAWGIPAAQVFSMILILSSITGLLLLKSSVPRHK